MRLNKSVLKRVALILLAFIIIPMVIGCDQDDGDTTKTYTVIYDGNGGYLGNKTATRRVLQVAENSKIPKYLDEYSDDEYVVSSLGLAMRSGYWLAGWYLDENAIYSESEYGDFVYLDLNDGNGIYSLDDEGAYVFGYVEEESGDLIYVNVEEIPADVNSYYLIESETGSYVYVGGGYVEYDSSNEEHVGLTRYSLVYIYYQGNNGYGFYLYDDDDAEQVAVFEADGGYSPSALSSYNTYLLYDDLTETEKTLFSELPRYQQEYYLYTEEDEGLSRYSLDSGYASLSSIMIVSSNGDYVLIDSDYVPYDSEDPSQAEMTRFSIDDKYVFTATDVILSPSDLIRYDATIDYWNFETQRVNSDITLLAHWVKKCTVNFVLPSGQTIAITTKLNDEHTESVDLTNGDTIGKLEMIPTYAGYTFVGWSTSQTEYMPWDFENDVFPEGTDSLTLYAYMIEGSYIRIISASGLYKVANDPTANYLLCADIDLNGAVYTNESPLGLKIQNGISAEIVPFSGSFVSMGYKISNFTMLAQNAQRLILEDAGLMSVIGLFPYVQNATISGVIVENATIQLSTTSSATTVVCDLGGAGIIGTAYEGTTTVTDCSIDIVFNATSATVIDADVYIGDIVAIGNEYCVITGSSATIDYSAITGITTGTLSIQTLE